jgi:GNAT superfamily N-acetyltransferase
VPDSAPGFRPGTVADADGLARQVADGLEVYRSFAPEGWEPPPQAHEAQHLRTLLAEPDVWCLVAERRGRLVGQVTVLPAARAARPVEDPGLAHLRNLFVDPECWGTGLASALNAAALGAAGDHGFTRMRLFTPAAHGRARRFYEREGWVPEGEEFHDPAPGLVLVEYRHALREQG